MNRAPWPFPSRATGAPARTPAHEPYCERCNAATQDQCGCPAFSGLGAAMVFSDRAQPENLGLIAAGAMPMFWGPRGSMGEATCEIVQIDNSVDEADRAEIERINLSRPAPTRGAHGSEPWDLAAGDAS